MGCTAALPDTKSIVGLVGLLVGVGEITGALSYGLLTKWSPNWARGSIILFAMVCHLTAFVLIFIGTQCTRHIYIVPYLVFCCIIGIKNVYNHFALLE